MKIKIAMLMLPVLLLLTACTPSMVSPENDSLLHNSPESESNALSEPFDSGIPDDSFVSDESILSGTEETSDFIPLWNSLFRYTTSQMKEHLSSIEQDLSVLSTSYTGLLTAELCDINRDGMPELILHGIRKSSADETEDTVSSEEPCLDIYVLSGDTPALLAAYRGISDFTFYECTYQNHSFTVAELVRGDRNAAFAITRFRPLLDDTGNLQTENGGLCGEEIPLLKGMEYYAANIRTTGKAEDNILPDLLKKYLSMQE